MSTQDTGFSAESDRHEYRDGRCVSCRRFEWEVRWEFVVTWKPEAGRLPQQVQHLFRHRSTLDHEQGRAVYVTDRGHSAFYVRAVTAWLAKHAPERQDDLVPTAVELPCPGRPLLPGIPASDGGAS